MTSQSSTPPELLPCPFCGGNATLWERESSYQVMCNSCDSRGHLWETKPPNQNKEMAIEKWNIRHTPTTPLPAELVKAIDMVALLKYAQAIVESKCTFKHFVRGTPLANDIAVWMAEFAKEVAAKQIRELQRKLDEWSNRELLGETERCRLEAAAELREQCVQMQHKLEAMQAKVYEADSILRMFKDAKPGGNAESYLQIWSNCLGNMVYPKSHWVDALGKTTRLLNDDKQRAQQQSLAKDQLIEKLVTRFLLISTNEDNTREAIVAALEALQLAREQGYGKK